VVEPARIPAPVDAAHVDDPPISDPNDARRAYHYHRAKRRARIERRRERRWARIRFWFMLGCLLVVLAVIGVLILQQIQNVFGI